MSSKNPSHVTRDGHLARLLLREDTRELALHLDLLVRAGGPAGAVETERAFASSLVLLCRTYRVISEQTLENNQIK